MATCSPLRADPATIVNLRGRQGDELRIRLAFTTLTVDEVALLNVRADVAYEEGGAAQHSWGVTKDGTNVYLTLSGAVTAVMPRVSYFDVLVQGPNLPAHHPVAGEIVLTRSITL